MMRLRLNWRQGGYMGLYIISLAIAVVFIHEGAHILTAVIRGVPFGELEVGFWGINPSITLPPGVNEGTKAVIFYAGGLTTGVVFLLVYLFYWVRKYRRDPSLLCWAMGLMTILFAANQFATGYLEGHYHGAYIQSATNFLSPADILTYIWMVAAVFPHFSLCPRKRMQAKEGRTSS